MKSIQKNNFIWNMLGSIAGAATTVLLTMIATRISGPEEGGVLGLALGLCFIVGTVGMFEVRPFQSTDLSEEFTFPVYCTARYLCCAVMLLFTAIYLILAGYDANKAQIVFWVCMFKMVDCLSDVFQGRFQQIGRLDLAGQMLFVRNVCSVITFAAALLLGATVAQSCVAIVLVSVLCVLLGDWRIDRRFDNSRCSKNFSETIKLLKKCFPLFISSFVAMYLANITKLQIDHYLPQYNAHWTAVFLPAAVINLFSLFVFRPMLTTLTEYWTQGEGKAFLRLGGLLVLWILAITGFALLLGYFWGTPVLGLLYGLDLTPWRGVLELILVGGGINALAIMFYYMLTVMRQQKLLLVSDGLTFLAAIIFVPLLTEFWGVNGAAFSFILIMIIRSSGFLLIIVTSVQAQRRRGWK